LRIRNILRHWKSNFRFWIVRLRHGLLSVVRGPLQKKSASGYCNANNFGSMKSVYLIMDIGYRITRLRHGPLSVVRCQLQKELYVCYQIQAHSHAKAQRKKYSRYRIQGDKVQGTGCKVSGERYWILDDSPPLIADRALTRCPLSVVNCPWHLGPFLIHGHGSTQNSTDRKPILIQSVHIDVCPWLYDSFGGAQRLLNFALRTQK